MLSKIRIQNFKSLKDVTVKLKKVNLLIGPNNSGKSNFLKALKFFSTEAFKSTSTEDHTKNTFRKRKATLSNPIHFNFFFKNDSDDENGKLKFEYKIFNQSGAAHTLVEIIDPFSEKEMLFSEVKVKETIVQNNIEKYFRSKLKIYSIANYSNLKNFKYYLTNTNGSANLDLEENFYNLIPFINNLRTNAFNEYSALETELKEFIKSFKHLNFIIAEDNSVGLSIIDENGVGLTAEDISDGTLYFIALLAVLHQPNPPKILMIEEPENGIHPRRIKELMDLIFDLAEEKDITIILTTHSTFVVDEFKDNMDAVFIFDMEDGETKIRNLEIDIINENIVKSKNANIPPLNLNGSLGKHWALGFLGGVPK